MGHIMMNHSGARGFQIHTHVKENANNSWVQNLSPEAHMTHSIKHAILALCLQASRETCLQNTCFLLASAHPNKWVQKITLDQKNDEKTILPFPVWEKMCAITANLKIYRNSYYQYLILKRTSHINTIKFLKWFIHDLESRPNNSAIPKCVVVYWVSENGPQDTNGHRIPGTYIFRNSKPCFCCLCQ